MTKLRKSAGISQRDLADMLQVRPSFLSAIENGKSRMPEEKIEKIKEIFELDNLDEYMIDDDADSIVPPHTHLSDQSESIAQLLNHFHDMAHQRAKSHEAPDAELEARLDFLSKRNDRLSDRVDDLRDEVDKLRKENLALKELLMQHGIDFHHLTLSD